MLRARAHLAELLVCLSLGTVLGTCSINVYAPLNASVNMDIPDVKLEPGDSVKWMSGTMLIAKSKEDVKVAGFTLFTNGSLLVAKLTEPKRAFTVEVHNKDGKLRKTCVFTLIGIEPLSEPTISHTCNERMEFSCSVARGQADTLLLLMDGKKVGERKSAKTVSSETSIEMDRQLSLKCVATNNVSQESMEVVIVCPTELDILLTASIAGACVIFVIFLLLLIYCVLRCRDQHYRKRISEEEVELPSMRAPQEARQRRLPERRNQPTCPTPYHPQPQPRHQLQQQQRKRPQPKLSPHPKMREEQPMRRQQKMKQGQAVSQQKTQQGQAVSQQNTLQGQAVSQQNTLQGQAVSQQNTLQGQAVSQQNMLQDQYMSQQKMQQSQPAAQHRMLKGHRVPQHMVQVYPTSQQQKAQSQLESQHNQLPQLPPHHPSSLPQEMTSRSLSHAQPRSSPHRTAEHQQHT